jgi:hypothetical protein
VPATIKSQTISQHELSKIGSLNSTGLELAAALTLAAALSQSHLSPLASLRRQDSTAVLKCSYLSSAIPVMADGFSALEKRRSAIAQTNRKEKTFKPASGEMKFVPLGNGRILCSRLLAADFHDSNGQQALTLTLTG